jgi:NAD(P)-dependent dehydrogenase (short-subunit alcohol dehydrogenase family)
MSLLSLTSGLRVLVTDGAVGIGQAIAERLVTAGARVFIRGAGRDGLARATERKPANNRAMMLIGDCRETNPDSDVFVCVESIDGVVGKLGCTDCQGHGTLPNTQSHSGHPRKCALCNGAGFLLVGL